MWCSVVGGATLPVENSQVNNYLCREESILQRLDLV
jgi:hypothetical protein